MIRGMELCTVPRIFFLMNRSQSLFVHKGVEGFLLLFIIRRNLTYRHRIERSLFHSVQSESGICKVTVHRTDGTSAQSDRSRRQVHVFRDMAGVDQQHPVGGDAVTPFRTVEDCAVIEHYIGSCRPGLPAERQTDEPVQIIGTSEKLDPVVHRQVMIQTRLQTLHVSGSE